MELSHNILIIDSLSSTPEYIENNARFKGEMNATVKLYCPDGTHFRSLIITSEGQSNLLMDALKQAIQNFLHGGFYYEVRDYDVGCNISNKIHHIDIRVEEPYKSLFELLFEASSWEIPKLGVINNGLNY